MEKTKYDFPVRLAAINSDSILIPNKLAVIREDTNEPIGIVSDKNNHRSFFGSDLTT